MRFSAEFECGFPVHWVIMKMRNNSSRTTKEIFEYTSDEDYGFNRNINMLHINANKDVEQMIMHALLNR